MTPSPGSPSHPQGWPRLAGGSHVTLPSVTAIGDPDWDQSDSLLKPGPWTQCFWQFTWKEVMWTLNLGP